MDSASIEVEKKNETERTRGGAGKEANRRYRLLILISKIGLPLVNPLLNCLFLNIWKLLI